MFSLSDRLAGLGMTELSQLLTGVLLVVVIVGLKGGIFERWQRRPRAGFVTFLVVLLLLLIPGVGSGFINALLFALLATVVVLVIPDTWWARLIHRPTEGARS